MAEDGGCISPVDSLDGDDTITSQSGVIKVVNEFLLSQLTSNSPLPIHKPANTYR